MAITARACAGGARLAAGRPSSRGAGPAGRLRRAGRAHGGRASPRETAERRFTVGGGGATGVCFFDEVRQAKEECDGLQGPHLDACFASFGCDVSSVTDHYAKVAGLKHDDEAKPKPWNPRAAASGEAQDHDLFFDP